MLTIGVLNEKGGVGKTMLATHLSAAAHLLGWKTLLLDLDIQGNADDWNRCRAQGSQLAKLDSKAVKSPLKAPQLAELARGYDCVVFDGPPRLGAISKAAAILSDVLLIPVPLTQWNLWATDNALHLFNEADKVRKELRLPASKRRFVCNLASPGAQLAHVVPPTLIGAEVAPVLLHRYKTFSLCEGTGESVQTRDPESKAAAEVQALFDYVVALAAERK
jgi:chromosome partitioning protein